MIRKTVPDRIFFLKGTSCLKRCLKEQVKEGTICPIVNDDTYAVDSDTYQLHANKQCIVVTKISNNIERGYKIPLNNV